VVFFHARNRGQRAQRAIRGGLTLEPMKFIHISSSLLDHPSVPEICLDSARARSAAGTEERRDAEPRSGEATKPLLTWSYVPREMPRTPSSVDFSRSLK
jgi:hypothetical protein